MRLAAQAALQQVAAQENQDALLQHHLHHHAHPLHAQQVPPHVHKYNVGMRSKAIGDQSDHLTMDGQQQQDAVPKAGGESEALKEGKHACVFQCIQVHMRARMHGRSERADVQRSV